MRIIAGLLFSILVVAGCSSTQPIDSVEEAQYEPEELSWFEENEWGVSEPLTVAEIESEAMRECEEYQRSPGARPDVPMVPFGFANDRWLEFKSKVQESDEIREIVAPPEYWSRLAGWKGFVLVREGKIVADMMTLIN